jgi:hypothetical protein
MVIAAMNDQGRHADFLHAKAGNSAFNKFQHESGSFVLDRSGREGGRTLPGSDPSLHDTKHCRKEYCYTSETPFN